jgi:hypothetical protein
MLNTLILALSWKSSIPAPTPQWDAPGLSGLVVIAGWVLAIVLVLCVIGGIVSAAVIGGGRVFDNGQMQSGGLKGLIGCGVGVAVCGVLVVVLNWIFGIF